MPCSPCLFCRAGSCSNYTIPLNKAMLINFLNKIISKWKGHDYKIDHRVSLYYIILLVCGRALMLVNGYLSFVSNKGLFFLSLRATIKSRSKLKVGRSVTIARGCYIDALSEKGVW